MASGNRAHLPGLAQQLSGNKAALLPQDINKRLNSEAFANLMMQQPLLRSKAVIPATCPNCGFAMVNIGLSHKMCDSAVSLLCRFLTKNFPDLR